MKFFKGGFKEKENNNTLTIEFQDRELNMTLSIPSEDQWTQTLMILMVLIKWGDQNYPNHQGASEMASEMALEEVLEEALAETLISLCDL